MSGIGERGGVAMAVVVFIAKKVLDHLAAMGEVEGKGVCPCERGRQQNWKSNSLSCGEEVSSMFM